MAKTLRLIGQDGTIVEVTRCEVVREPSSPTGWVARGVTPRGALARFVVPGATLDGVPLKVPGAEAQRAAAPESGPAKPGEPKGAGKAPRLPAMPPAPPPAPEGRKVG